jgi:transposase
MLADELDYVVGVDPHRDEHALAIVEVRSGVVVYETNVAADSSGYADALAVAEQQAPGRRAFAVEGTGSYGAGLTRFLTSCGERVRGRTSATGAPLRRHYLARGLYRLLENGAPATR